MPKNKLLLVDDEADITSTLRIGLERLGFEVDTFNNSTEALSQFKPAHYDDIILDVRMPGMTGFELARGIWQKDKQAKICFLSAFETYEDEARGLVPNIKSHCFITKPISVARLAEHIESHLLVEKID